MSLMATAEGAAAATKAVQDAVENIAPKITTAYTDVKIPTSSIITYGVGILLVIAAVIAAIVLLRNHVKNWVYPLFAGAVFYLVFSYVLPELFTWLCTIIPGVREWAIVQPDPNVEFYTFSNGYKLVYLGFHCVTDFLGIFLGLKYLIRSEAKQNLHLQVGHIFSFALAGFLVMALVGDTVTRFYHAFTESGGVVTSYYQGVYISNMINSVGFDQVISDAVEAGQAENLAVDYLLTFVNTSMWTTLVETLVILVHGILVTAAAVFTYGWLKKSLSIDGLFAGIGAILLYWAPFFYQAVKPLNVWITGAYYLAIGALAVFGIWYVLKNHLAEDAKALQYSRKDELKKEEEKKKKMPKIVMPKD